MKVEADATETEILELIRHTDQIAEIPNSLRFPTGVRMAQALAIVAKP